MFQFIEANDWDGALAYVAENADSAGISDKYGMIPLHHAAGRNAPIGFITRLLEINSQGVKCMDIKGRLPLHYACDYQAPLETVKLLVSAHKTSVLVKDKNDMTAIEYALDCDSVLEDVEVFLTESEGELRTQILERFQNNRIFFHRAKAIGVKNVEIFGDKNDLYLKWCIKDTEVKRTITMENCGANADWNLDHTFAFDVSACLEDTELKTPLVVAVYDANSFRSDVLIGESKLSVIDLFDLPYHVGCHVTLPVLDKKSSSKVGSLELTIVIKPPLQEQQAAESLLTALEDEVISKAKSAVVTTTEILAVHEASVPTSTVDSTEREVSIEEEKESVTITGAISAVVEEAAKDAEVASIESAVEAVALGETENLAAKVFGGSVVVDEITTYVSFAARTNSPALEESELNDDPALRATELAAEAALEAFKEKSDDVRGREREADSASSSSAAASVDPDAPWTDPSYVFDETVKIGLLHKMSRGRSTFAAFSGKNWKQRQFILKGNKILSYGEEGVNISKGELSIRGCKLRSLSPADASGRKHAFEVITSTETLVLAANNAVDELAWMKILEAVGNHFR